MRALFIVAVATGCNETDLVGNVLPDVVPAPYDPAPPEREDVIIQVTSPIVDTLYVIDNSCSMEDEQAKLADNFPTFIDFFVQSGLDYHVGVVTTDTDNPADSGKLKMGNGALWIDNQTEDPIGAFDKMAKQGIDGSGLERGLDAAYLALFEEIDQFNEGFVREHATLHVVMITDELDQSNIITRDEFADLLLDFKAEPGMVTFSSIVWPEGVGTGPLGESAGTDYMFVTEHVGGIIFDIREDDWSPVMEELGIQAAGLKREFFLTQLPVVDTIEVSVVDAGARQVFATTDYIYDGLRNSITFVEYIPNPLAEIHIKYTLLTSEAQD